MQMTVHPQSTSFTNLSNRNFDSSAKGVLTPVSPEDTTSSKIYSTYFTLPVSIFEKLFNQQSSPEEKTKVSSKINQKKQNKTKTKKKNYG